ncbi:MAG: insulinase family protein [Proteobacteria bacterium]|nr:insulinase family protein [Pseudomonadota bacterium]
MPLFLRRLLVALPLLLLVAAAPPTVKSSAPWPQVGSDLPVDKSVVFGTLPNGMRYAIKHNDTPKGAVSLRFRFDVGSLMERDNEQGIAHVLEHMAFRGSKHVADGDTVRILQSLGLAFGADTNAFTAATQTVYSFDMPKNDEASIDTALMLMREIAGNLNISQAALDTERNVVLAEARLRDVPVAHLRKSDWAFLYGDRAASALLPIGLEKVVANANAKLVRDFYEAWYRPERATMIIVGDIDPKAVEAKLKAKFSDWRAKAPPRKAVRYHPLAKRPSNVKLFNEPGVQPYLLFTWLQPYDNSPDNRKNEARDLIRYIATAVFNMRMAELAHAPSPPFVGASANHDHMGNIADYTELRVSYRPGESTAAIEAAERAWRDAVAHGVRQDEVDLVVAQLRTFFQTRATAADTTPTTDVIDALLRYVDDRNVYTSPQSDLVLFENVVKGLKAKTVSQALRYVFGGTGPLLFVTSDTPLPGGEAAVKKALADADGTPLAAGAAQTLPPWPYGDFGKPGEVTARTTVSDLGVTDVRFANGVTLTIKPTALRAGQVLVNVRLGKGRLGLPRDHTVPLWALSGFYISGGLNHYTIDDLQKLMADKTWDADLAIGDDDFSLSGEARPADLDNELQILAAYVTDPAFKTEAFEQARTAYANSLRAALASPSSVFGREIYGRLHDGDVRWRAATLADVEAATPEQAEAILAPALKDGPIDITIVGDVDVDKAVQSVAATFGALPPRAAEGGPVTGDEHFPASTPKPVVLEHHGAENQAVAMIAWPTTGFYKNMREQRVIRVLAEIFSQRLLDELRTREGITYTPGASSYASLLTPDYGFVYALAQIPPDKVDTFYREVGAVVADLAAKPVSQAELDRARGPRIEDIQKQQQTNEYWLSLLSGSQQDPRLLDVIRTTIPDLKDITPDDIQKAAQTWLKGGTAYRLVVMPADKAAPTP